jgi:hypothetical protein
MFSLDLIPHTLYTNVVNHVYQYDNKVVLFRDNLLRQYQYIGKTQNDWFPYMIVLSHI